MTLALEPEAAALFTKEQELIRHTEEERVKLVPFVPQSKFMVVDLGGKKYKREYVIRNYKSKKFKKLKRLQLLIFEICTESGAFPILLSDVWEIDKYA